MHRVRAELVSGFLVERESVCVCVCVCARFKAQTHLSTQLGRLGCTRLLRAGYLSPCFRVLLDVCVVQCVCLCLSVSGDMCVMYTCLSVSMDLVECVCVAPSCCLSGGMWLCLSVCLSRCLCRAGDGVL